MAQPPRPKSSFIRSTSELQHQTPASADIPKSCLVRSKTLQAPVPPRLLGEGTGALRGTRSRDRDSCLSRRRRADGVPVICSSPLASPEDERGRVAWGSGTYGANDAPATKNAKSAVVIKEKPKLSRWRRFRRAASEESQRNESSSSSNNSTLPGYMDDVVIKRQIQAGRWPFEAPLNAECSCKNCHDTIELGLASDYEPKWTRAARIRWLEAQEQAVGQSPDSASATGPKSPRSTTRIAIQADEVAQLHNETAHPMSEAELADEPTSPTVERGEVDCGSTAAEAIGLGSTKLPNPTGLDEGDETLRRQILARRQTQARQSPVMRPGARSMMRQIEEAERREVEVVRSASREGYRECGSGSGRCSPASPPCTSRSELVSTSVSTTPQEPSVVQGEQNASYFHSLQPPQRVQSPLIPADVAAAEGTVGVDSH
nr:putative protein [Melanopsichium pennsylvanicum 4]